MTAASPDPDGTRVEVEYAVDSGWLVEVVNEHTCGAGPGSYAGMHEPGCGSIPVARIEDLLREQVEAERLRRSKAALAEKVKQLQDQIARAAMGPGQDRQKAIHAYAARAESAEARVAAGLAVLAEHRRMCNPAPYTSERALAERMDAALAHATPSDAAQGEGKRATHDVRRGRGDFTPCWCAATGDHQIGNEVADRDAVRLSEEAFAEHWFHDGGDTCECGYWAEFDSVKRHHLIDALSARLAHDAPAPEGAGGREGGSEATERDLSDFGGGNGAGGSSEGSQGGTRGNEGER